MTRRLILLLPRTSPRARACGPRPTSKSSFQGGGAVFPVATSYPSIACWVVCIARALINDPALVLADEPTGNLDANAANEVMGLLQQLNEEGRTILLVTHDPAVASYAFREIFLRGGAVVSDRALERHADRGGE